MCWSFHGSLNEALCFLCVFDGHNAKGERVSEYCMTELPFCLEKDHAAHLVANPVGCLHGASISTSIFRAVRSAMAMLCGTTSNVLYMNGNDVWLACSSDSCAIKAHITSQWKGRGDRNVN